MKHIIFGGDGFLGTELTKKLTAKGESVLVCDLNQTLASGIYDDKSLVGYIRLDVTDKESFAAVEVALDDVVYHFAAKLLVPILPRAERKDYFWKALYVGTRNVFAFMEENGLKNLVYYTTDMVYGHTLQHPRYEDHPRAPLGPYGEAKYQTELLCDEYRAKGFNITLFRPRLIIGPGRLGILEKLFKLIDNSLPVPTIGNGKNFYQFISVSDCAEACICAVKAGFPNENYNLGSLNPPTVNDLLKQLIAEANSKSFLLPTPASLVKFVLDLLDRLGKPIMDPEQYMIADETCVLDVSKAKRDLNWEPQDNDVDMLFAAYNDYHRLLQQARS
jgi:dTDP-glucose 4,6-dehydratase